MNFHELIKIIVSIYLKQLKILGQYFSQGGRGPKMYAHLLSRGTNSIVDNIVV